MNLTFNQSVPTDCNVSTCLCPAGETVLHVWENRGIDVQLRGIRS